MSKDREKIQSIANEIVVLVDINLADGVPESLAIDAMLLAYHRLFGSHALNALLTGKLYVDLSNSNT